MNKKNILILAIVIVIIALGGWYLLSNKNTVAVVNGEEISSKEFSIQFDQVEQTYLESDTEFDKKQVEEYVLNQMINTILLKQEAENKGYTVEDSEVQEEIDFITDNGGGQEMFEQALVEAGVSEEMLREDIRNQILINNYIISEFPEENISVTDEEIRSLYDSYSQSATEGEMPSFEEAEEGLRTELIQQKRNSMIEELINNLRESAEIKVLL